MLPAWHIKGLFEVIYHAGDEHAVSSKVSCGWLCEFEFPLLAKTVAEVLSVHSCVCGYGAVMVKSVTGQWLIWSVSFVFGAVVAALIYGMGHLGGAHFNQLWRWGSGQVAFLKAPVLPYIWRSRWSDRRLNLAANSVGRIKPRFRWLYQGKLVPIFNCWKQFWRLSWCL